MRAFRGLARALRAQRLEGSAPHCENWERRLENLTGHVAHRAAVSDWADER